MRYRVESTAGVAAVIASQSHEASRHAFRARGTNRDCPSWSKRTYRGQSIRPHGQVARQATARRKMGSTAVPRKDMPDEATFTGTKGKSERKVSSSSLSSAALLSQSASAANWSPAAVGSFSAVFGVVGMVVGLASGSKYRRHQLSLFPVA